MKTEKLKLTPFTLLVLETIKKIPHGRVSTYKEVARAVGKMGASRAVGNALNQNPWAPRVPCHRIVKSDGSIGGYGGGRNKKIKLLAQEGVKTASGKIVDFKKKIFKF